LTYRNLTRVERTLVNRAFDRWGVFDFFKDKSLLIQENGTKKICLVPDWAESILHLQPYLAGLIIGDLKKQFVPSMAGAHLFSQLSKANEFHVHVNDNAEKLVIYGRDVMGESITQASSLLNENELVILLNQKSEAIGIGRTRFAGKSIFQKGRITITTIADLGYYLREEG